MESLNKIVEQAKEVVGQYTGSSTTTESKSTLTDAQTSSSDAPVLADAPDAVDGIGPTGGAALIEHEGVANADAPNVDQGAEYSATGRDATGTFDGGANDPPNLGAGVMPGRAT